MHNIIEDSVEKKTEEDFNYLIGRTGKLPADYDYRNRPDPDTDGCKKLYDDIIAVWFSSGIICDEVVNLEQQFRYNPLYEKYSNEENWKFYQELNNADPAQESQAYKPPYYTIVYKDYVFLLIISAQVFIGLSKKGWKEKK